MESGRQPPAICDLQDNDEQNRPDYRSPSRDAVVGANIYTKDAALLT
jgi:hypothetical protein